MCRQLSTVSYHPSVQFVQGCHTAIVSRVRPSTSKNTTLPVSDKEVPKLIPTSQSVTEKLMQQVPVSPVSLSLPYSQGALRDWRNIHPMKFKLLRMKQIFKGKRLKTVEMLCHK